MITAELFERLFPSKGLSPQKYNLIAKRQELIQALNTYLPQYEINTYRRVCAYLSCCGVETDYWKTSVEYASGADYEGRKDLGNTQKGDGRRFKGRSPIQTTGRYNYERVQKRIGKRLNIDVVANPELLADVAIGVQASLIFWQENDLNKYADAKQIRSLNGIVNRGSADKMPLQWSKRNELYSKCIRYIPQDFQFEQPAVADPIKPIDITPEMENNFSSAADIAKGPTAKTLLGKVGGRIGTPLMLAWSTTTGKVLMVITALLIISALLYTAYLYRRPLQIGWETAKAYLKKKVGLT